MADVKKLAIDLLASLDPEDLNPEQFNAWSALSAELPTITAEAGEVSEAEVEQRVLGAIDDFREMQPESDEDWESWYSAAFDLAREKVAGILAARRVQPKQDAPSLDVAGLIEALEPFARLGDGLSDEWDDERRLVSLSVDASHIKLKHIRQARTALSRLTSPKQDDAHPDDHAVDRFAAAMKVKLAEKRNEGRGGWEDKNACTAEFLSELLRGHVDKGEPLDVGNFAMMLHQRGERITPKQDDAREPDPIDVGIAAMKDSLKAALDARDSTVGAEPAAASTRPSSEGYEWTPDKDDLGRKVRAAWVAWAETQPNPKASWLMPYDDLSEADKEADRQIGEALTAELTELAEGLEKWGDEQSARADAAEASIASARADGLEEAAKVVESEFRSYAEIAAAIRALIPIRPG